MSEEQSSSAEDSSFNAFNNDGSFMEQFRRMQEQQRRDKGAASSRTAAGQLAAAKTTTSNFMPATLASKRVTKGGAVIMKLSGVKKKKAEQAVKLTKPPAALRGDSSSEDEGEMGKKESNAASSSSSSYATPTAPPTTSMPTTNSFLMTAQPTSVSASGVGGASAGNVGGVSLGNPSPGAQQLAGKKRKRASRWSDAPPSTEVTASSSKSAKKQSADDVAIAEAMASFDAMPAASQMKCRITETQLQQIREQIEINRQVAEIQRTMQEMENKKSKYNYDSDEDTEGGTWEHKNRMKEMEKTRERARELTEMNRGKHHISDFLPPEELSKFIERVQALKEGRDPDFSDYKEHKITEENIGFKMLQKAGWTEGAGLGAKEEGITAPINKGKSSFDQSGVGAVQPAEIKKDDDEFDLYRKRMMLAYRFRPNPLNNPRRPYY